MTVTASEFKYEPAVIRVRAGQIVNLAFKNAGTVIHEFRLRDVDPRVETKAMPGEGDSVSFDAPRVGTYKFMCLVPGRQEAGMVGQLVIE